MKKLGWLLIGLAILYTLLLIPDSNKFDSIVTSTTQPFEWKQDDYWKSLEQKFVDAKKLSSDSLLVVTTLLYNQSDSLLSTITQDSIFQHNDVKLSQLLNNFFELGPYVAASENFGRYIQLYNRARSIIKNQSRFWKIDDPEIRVSIYKLLYGMRASTEEILLQHSQFSAAELIQDEASQTPSATIQGIKVHSGDLLVSRGGAEVSAFISRGNDFPGNFSHVAFLYVEEETQTPYLIEAHIEKGVAIATAEEYWRDKKLRFMVLRPRADIYQLVKNPMLPHLAAKLAYEEAQSRHIPYDFKMNFQDSSAMFCSEVGSYGYRKNGIQLWQAVSTISSQGTANWLNTFGVENFVTQMPSDLEYDPQLSVVAEWRDPETLLKDHIDNAVMDALLEEANQGKEIDYTIWMLPIARVIKGYSIFQNLFGKPGIIPEGMNATRALKNNSFVALYATTKSKTVEKIEQFKKKNHYNPPYWQMLSMARASIPD